MTPRCSYCWKPAVEWFKYFGFIRRGPSQLPNRPLITVGACRDHFACPTYRAERKTAQLRGVTVVAA